MQKEKRNHEFGDGNRGGDGKIQKRCIWNQRNKGGSREHENNYRMFYSGVKVRVGIIINEWMSHKVIKVQTINSRILTISLKLEEIVNIVLIYGPVEK